MVSSSSLAYSIAGTANRGTFKLMFMRSESMLLFQKDLHTQNILMQARQWDA
jgi:hypothetical protein